MKFKIQQHSIIDIITNSSSEIFTFQGGKSKEFLVELINQFCKDKNINFSVTKSCFSQLDEEDYEIGSAMKVLIENGYTVTRDPNKPPVYELDIDRDLIYTHLQPLKDFLLNDLNATMEYDG